MKRDLSRTVKMISNIFHDMLLLVVSGTNARGEERQGLSSPSASIN